MNARVLAGLVLALAVTTAWAQVPPKSLGGRQSSAGVTLTRDLWWTDTAERAAVQGAVSQIALPLIATTRAQAGDIEGAVRMARRFDTWGEIWSEVAVAAARAGRIEDVRRAIENVRRAHFDKDALAAVAKAQVEAGALDKARQTAALIDDQARRGGVLVAVANAEVRAGRLEAARRAAEGVEDPVQCVRAMLALADERIARGESRAVRDEVAAALGRTARIERLADRSEQLRAVLDRFFAIGALDDVARVLDAQADSMGILGLDAQVRLAEARLSGGDRIGAGQAASRALSLLRPDGKPPFEPFGWGTGWVPRQEVAKPGPRIARIQVLLGDLAGARGTFGDTTVGLVVLCKALFESGNQAGARSLLEQEIIPQLERNLQFGTAVEVARLQHAHGDPDGASSTMKRVRSAIERTRQDSNSAPSPEAVVDQACELAKSQVSGADWLVGEARQTLALARERIDHLPPTAQSAERFGRVAALAAGTGDHDAARMLFEQADRLAADDLDTLIAVMIQRLAAKDLQGVRSMLGRACDVIDRRESPDERSALYSWLVQSLAKGGDVDGAEVAFGRADRSLTRRPLPGRSSM